MNAAGVGPCGGASPGGPPVLSPGGPLVLVGPSGAGKTTIAERLVRSCPQRFVLSVSATTRAPRAGERNGRQYRFVSRAEFEAMIENGELAEWARVHGRYYGTPLRNLTAEECGGRTPVLDIDVQGARQVAERVEGAIQVFVVPPGPEQWLRRLARRGTETPGEIARRLRTALAELDAAASFERVVVNRELDQAVADVLAAADLVRGEAGVAPATGTLRRRLSALCQRLSEGARAEIARLQAASRAGT